MNRTKIEWCDYTINPVKGLCPMACDYCYARRMYLRFKWNPEIRYIEPGFIYADILTIKKPSRIFWGSTFELFHDTIPDLWRKDIFSIVRQFPQHTHLFLTKQPQNLIEWSPFPGNCWVGVTATNRAMIDGALRLLEPIKATTKFLSIEPLLLWSPPKVNFLSGIQWLIIGQQTPISAKTQPKIEWIREIVQAADKAGIPVFLKNNLEPLLGQDKDYKRFRGYDAEGNMLVSLRQELKE